ncbi:hypothetical protein N0V93_009529 [Gnomoniopsis smithogilvyi]|uniref:Rhodopsin domain-containing protein n=1 Tax=Gnomoniopsis smithogilvyi TaxID=1191159 RepID=A0A9W8YKP2_9PEZI|nr:hypothetical protein N0V93_009529 [Gnomoniopsis smithogilvyi]
MQPGGNSGGLLAVAILAIILGTLAVALRIYTRKVVLNQLWVDDYLACASWVCLMGLVAQNFHNISTGLGSHFADIPPQTVSSFYLDMWLGLLIYQVTLLFTKLTLFFQFYRIIRQTSWKRQKVFYIVLMAVIAAWQIGQVFIQIFACNPVAKSWDMSIEGTCQPISVMRNMNASANIVSDFMILLLPLPIIWRLELPLRQRLALGGIFCLGFFTCIIAILRITVTGGTVSDPSWQTSNIVAWTTAEVMTGVIIASLSTLRPLIGRYVPGWATRTGGTSRGASYKLKTFSSTIGSNVDRKSTFYARPRRISGGAWLDVEEEVEQEQAELVGKYGGVSLRYPMPPRLGPGMARSVGSIRVTKEWSVEANKPVTPTPFDEEEASHQESSNVGRSL